MCRPGIQGTIDKLNAGLRTIIEDDSLAELCSRAEYFSIPCVTSVRPHTPLWPTNAEVTLMVEADFPPYSDYSVVQGLHGFDVELARLVCEAADISCALLSAPWKSAWPGDGYPGEGAGERYSTTAISVQRRLCRFCGRRG